MSDFERPPLTSLITQAQDDINGRLPGADSRLRRSVLGVFAKVWAGLIHGVYGFLAWLAQQLLPDTATGEWLARWASIWGLTRKAATSAAGAITVSGTITSVVPAGTQLQRSDGALFVTGAEVTLAGVTAVVQVTAVVAGAGGITTTGSSLTFVSPVAGVSSSATVNTPGIAAGTDEESDEALRGRLLARIRNPPQGGSKADYEAWALEVAGVTRAWVYPRHSGAGTVGLTFVMDGREDIIPTEDDIAAVVAHVEALMPVTPELLCFAPIPDAIAMTIALTPNTDPVKAAVLAQLEDLFSREAIPAGTISLNKINEAISLAEGETDHTLTIPAAPVVSATGHIARLGTVTWA
ncbi:baseplate J-like family protein [Asticcacaulis biprosthecium C19]|uniref:Baseplate J-like family protein n=1 Tax=Asticcacaulis biprosthecium C19 TaxID=715226 RepID=F4QG85_9CAUL|nr:baseplate J/gp47 family protein [Asticcacaulis biprosthecium]EGF92413.1 baseplate J-like family protein [Asticcacaulis biprosthecium C19]